MFTTTLLIIQVLGDITPCRLANGTDVSDDRNYFISGMLRRTYWYIVGDVSEDRNSFISVILLSIYWYIVGKVSKAL